jgi:hypothetical protein
VFSKPGLAILLVYGGLFPAASLAKDVVLYLSGPETDAWHSSQLVDLRQKIERELLQSAPNIEVRVASPLRLDASSFSVIDEKWNDGDRLRGVLFLGHGNETTFYYSQGTRYQAQELAEYLVRLSEHVKFSDDFLVYMGGCRNACPLLNGENFSKALSGHLLKAFKEQQIVTRSVEVIGHVFMTGKFRMDSPSLLDRVFRRIGTAAVTERLVLKVFPRSIIALGGVPFATLFSGIAASLAVSHLNHEAAGTVYALSLLASVFLALSPTHTDKIVESFSFDAKNSEPRRNKSYLKPLLQASLGDPCGRALSPPQL